MKYRLWEEESKASTVFSFLGWKLGARLGRGGACWLYTLLANSKSGNCKVRDLKLSIIYVLTSEKSASTHQGFSPSSQAASPPHPADKHLTAPYLLGVSLHCLMSGPRLKLRGRICLCLLARCSEHNSRIMPQAYTPVVRGVVMPCLLWLG